MKKIYALFLLLAIVGFSFAQRVPVNKIDSPLDLLKKKEVVKPTEIPVKRSKGDTLYTIPYFENFETINPYWNVTDSDNDGAAWYWASQEGEAKPHSGTKNIYSYHMVDNSNMIERSNWIFSPQIDLSNATNPRLSFWVSSFDHAFPMESYSVIVSNKKTIEEADYTDTLFAETLTSANYKQRVIDLSAYAGDTINIAFVHHEPSVFKVLNIDDVRIYETAQFDAAVTEIISPVDTNMCGRSSENVTVQIKNNGTDDISNFDVTFVLNDTLTVTESVSATISAGAVYDFTFSAPIDLSVDAEHKLKVYTSLAGDAKTDNDTLEYFVASMQGTLKIIINKNQHFNGETQYALFDQITQELIAYGEADAINDTIDVCVFNSKCFMFALIDRYGDGLTNTDSVQFGKYGTYTIIYNGDTIANSASGNFSSAIVDYSFGEGCPNTEVSLSSIDIPMTVFFNKAFDITGEVKNLGVENLTSFDVVYEIFDYNGNSISKSDTFNVAGIDISTGRSHQFTHNVPAKLTANGYHRIDVTIIKENDVNTENNELMAWVYTSQNYVQRKVLVEKGTNTGCGYCAEVFPILDELLEPNKEKLTVIEYHWGYPDEADPFFLYNDFDNLVRINTVSGDYQNDALYGYYKLPGGVPVSYIDGDYYYPSELTQEDFDRKYNTPSPFMITGSALYNPSLGTIDVNGVITCVDGYGSSGLKYRMAVVEDSIDYAAVNGQTRHNSVMRFMIPHAYGVAMNPMATNDIDSFNETFPLPAGADTTFNPSNIKVVLFVQDDETREVLQSEYLDITVGIDDVESDLGINIYPNPTNGTLNIEGVDNSTINIYNMLGGLVLTTESLSSAKKFDMSYLPQGTYFVKIQKDGYVINKKIVLTK